MINDIKSIIKKLDLKIKSIKKIKKVIIVDTDKGKYVLKRISSNNNIIINYLDSKGFHNIPNSIFVNNYKITPYIEEEKIPVPDKAISLVYLLSLLHNKTTFYKEVSLDKVKEIYERLNSNINNLEYYYHDIQDVIEQRVYMSPAEYLLIRNISLIYSSLSFAKYNLDKWYDIKKDSKKERIVLLHNRPCLEHIISNGKDKIINWDYSKRDMPIYDFIYFYKHDYLDLEMESLFNLYQSKFYYTNDEYLLFTTIIAIPEKIIFTKNNYKDQKEVYKLIRYMEKTNNFISKKDKSHKEENEDKLEEQNNSI